MKFVRTGFFILFLSLIPVWGCSRFEVDTEIEEYKVEEVPILSDENGWDMPANDGIKNALLNARQLVEIKYTPIAEFNTVGETLDAGTSVQGVVYSSTRAEDLLVPNNVSLWTYMSAFKNPHSYLYTVDISMPPYSIKGSAKPYYGQVCTSFIQYALGIKYNFQIVQMTKWEGFDKIIPQNVDKMRLGDVLISLNGHTMMITGIRREKGHVEEIAISEGVSPCARERIYPVQYVIDAMDNEQFVIYRYRYINNTKHMQSSFVCVGDEVPRESIELPCENVMPRRGDKANWRKDEPVVLDILYRGIYSEYKLYKDNMLLEESSIPESCVLDFGIMPHGNYSLCLSNGEEDSKYVYWIVADYNIFAQAVGNRKVMISFSSSNCIPIWITWRRPAIFDSDYNNGPLWTTVISESDRLKGYVISELDLDIAKKYGMGFWDFKVAYETIYGIINSDSETVYTY